MYPSLMCRGALWGGTPGSYERKIDTVENGRNNEAHDIEKSSEKAEEEEEEEEQDFHLQIDSKRKATMFYLLKVVKGSYCYWKWWWVKENPVIY